MEHQQAAVADAKREAPPKDRSLESGPGVIAVQGILASGSNDIAKIVEVFRAHRDERDSIFDVLHRSLGNAFVMKVIDADAKMSYEQTPKAEQLANAPLPAAERATIRADIINERLAHGLAYHDTLTEEDTKFLDEQGLQLGKIVHGAGGLDLATFVPKPGSKSPPVLAFRGTSGFVDIVEDTNSAGVGTFQMAANEGLIKQTLSELAGYGPPTVTGHSLGGALAQMAATRFPGSVGRVVTFQSPGIPANMAKKLDEHNANAERAGKPQVESHHYAVQGDLVPLAGQAFTSGFLHVIDRGYDAIMDGGPMPGLFKEHTAYPLKEFVESGEGLGSTPVGASLNGRTPASARESSADDRWTSIGKKLHGFAEAIRAGTGKVIETTERLAHMGHSPRADYVAVWEHVRAAIDAKANPKVIEQLIASSKIRDVDKKLMIENLHKIVH